MRDRRGKVGQEENEADRHTDEGRIRRDGKNGEG